MAGAHRTQAHDLTASFLQRLDLRRAGLFAIVRQLEARETGKPRVGRAKRPEQSVVDLAQQPTLGFAESTLTGTEPARNRIRLRGYWLGLTGPMGALPTHLSEFAYYEKLYAQKHPFTDWLDVLAGRMLQFFYRAWADSQPVSHADRATEDRFAAWLSALSGCAEGADEDDAFFRRARCHYVPLFSGLRSAVAIEDSLSHLLCQPVRVVEYIPKWRALEHEDLTCLGQSFATLGSDAVLGRKVFSASDAFRVIVRASNYRDYLSLLPVGERFAVAAEAIEAFKPGHLEWDLTVEIADADAPGLRLDGGNRLGWTSWLKPPAPKRSGPRAVRQLARPERIRADAHLRKTSVRKRKTAP
ncbi:type VI secretion system baseplate subunit TssG [Novosphingobium album (ex Liu et al. 2023)]|uniref:Type VI secretion system baseplate subunit TssG n=1 Tax=Novosphingobium album (ex Liu et al. 2023) TaxID=3031130 RepID=A0ABT5WUY9_9SPHN|nr:type VI secretion system baseplate subunit TssG [Novosphingobium album (ex Liu et al. 2023)]MDE8653698.1 type VI secretion system baseplate subunit TssG [Novosphingobium album (ex Liu et al. 2023)]